MLPLIGLIYVSGMDYWSSVWPEKWSPIANVRAAVDDPVIRRAILTSVTLGVGHRRGTGADRAPRRLRPAAVPAPRPVRRRPDEDARRRRADPDRDRAARHARRARRSASSAGWLLFIGYLVVFLPFASVLTTGAQHQIGKDVVEAAKIAGASDLRTFRSIVTPLTRPALVATFMLMYVLVSGETNISLILASTQRPVVGFVMLDLFNFASFPKVASFALVITAVNLTVVAMFMKVLSGRTRFGVR